MNQDLPVIQQLMAGEDNIFIHYNVNNMAELMSECDAAISAAGSTLYELCATQTPTITYILADNQILGAESFERNGVLKNAGDVRVLGAERLSCRLIRDAVGLCDDYAERCRIARRQRMLVDGRGAEKVMKWLMKE